MYIGAWTEYRLALEKFEQKQTGRQNAGQQHQQLSTAAQGNHHHPASAPLLGREGRAGIYHPSLPDKGGEGVGNLPDRESFRRTLESTLSSNLAADDAENISQALEPLLQRLPTIHKAAGAGGRTLTATHARRNRRQTRRSARCFDKTARSEGTRSARLASSSDGTRSARSAFSVASAPTKTMTLHVISTKKSRGGACGRFRKIIPTIPRLARAENARAALSVVADNGNRPVPSRKRRGSARVSDECSSSGNNNSNRHSHRQGNCRPPIGGREFYDGITHLDLLTPDTEPGSRNVDDSGFDSGKAATLLRLARSRDPAGIKADFQQFWRWNSSVGGRTKGKAHKIIRPSEEGKPSVPENTKDTILQRAAKIGGGRTLSKLETLARMKNLYMARGVERVADDSQGDAAGVSSLTSPTTTGPHCNHNGTHVFIPKRSPHDRCERGFPEDGADDRDIASAISGSDDQFSCRLRRGKQNPSDAGNTSDGNTTRRGSVEAGEGERYRRRWRPEGRGGAGADDDACFPEEPVVVVPDLELTESRIRLVDKYFGGERARRRRRPPVHEENSQPVVPEAEAARTTSLLNSKIDEGRTSTFATYGHVSSTGNNTGHDGRSSTAMSGSVAVGDNRERQQPNLPPQNETQGSRARGIKLASERLAHVCNKQGLAPDQIGGDCVANPTEGSHGRNSSSGISRDSKPTSSSSCLSLTYSTLPDFHPPSPKGDCPHKKSVSQPTATPRGDGVGIGVAVPAPAWCGDSLEDLVCWTRQLDFDAAVEGF